MDKQPGFTRIRNMMKFLFWGVFLAFFAYSFQNIMDFEALAHPRRLENFVRILTAFSQPNLFDGEVVRQVIMQMWETVQIGFLATTLGAIFAALLTFLSARPSSLWGRVFNMLLQPLLLAIRAIHPLIFTIPAIVLVGIGPTAGVLVLTLFSTAVLTRNFSEFAQEHESLDWGIQLKLYYPGLALKHFPVNILIATVLGFMGGGGIGFIIQQDITLLNYGDASVAIIACIIVIGGIDLLSWAVWHNNLKTPSNSVKPDGNVYE